MTLQGNKRLVALDIKSDRRSCGTTAPRSSGSSLVKSIRAGTPQDTQTLRLLVDLTEDGKTRAVKQQNGANYTVVFPYHQRRRTPPPPPPPGGGETGRPAAGDASPDDDVRAATRSARRVMNRQNGDDLLSAGDDQQSGP
ncbi:hypothetical protein LNQ52_06470 [Klebsiella pneumoniae subsp. pneumoniae]|nr:hypothetical protein [Klebsiella pneumoniae subsp. pneumoniae]